MKNISKLAWDNVHAISCDVANAAMAGDVVLFDVHRTHMFTLLDELESEFGIHPIIMSTRADYMEDGQQRRRLYEAALKLARKCGNETEEIEILDSLTQLDTD